MLRHSECRRALCERQAKVPRVDKRKFGGDT
jgi:hypothetical protein